MNQLEFKILERGNIQEMLPLVLQLNSKYTKELMLKYLNEMFDYDTYSCFGIYEGSKLIGLSSGWTTTKLYSGKQLEIDNVVVDENIQSRGYGKFMEAEICKWCKERNYESIELNTYVRNFRSHKFYFNQGYEIIGYHFEKSLSDKPINCGK